MNSGQQNEQLRQDVIDCQRQIDSQRESLMSRGEGQDYKTVISKKNMELVQYLNEIQVSQPWSSFTTFTITSRYIKNFTNMLDHSVVQSIKLDKIFYWISYLVRLFE